MMHAEFRKVFVEVEPDRKTIAAMKRRGLLMIGPWYFPLEERWNRAIESACYETMQIMDPFTVVTR